MRGLSFALVLTVGLAGCAVTPEPATQADIDAFTTATRTRLQVEAIPVTGPITLAEAMARALKTNLDIRVEARQRAVAAWELSGVTQQSLPDVVSKADGFGRWRDFDFPEWSRISQTADLDLTFDVLDFGVSYVRARQAADKVLIAEEQRRRVMHRIVEDTRTAFWRAVSYDRLIKQMRALEASVNGALNDARALSRQGATAPLPSLTYERELLTVRRDIQELERDLVVARDQLAALMNIAPGTPFTLAEPKRRDVPSLSLGAGEMVDVAFANRPEVRQLFYERRINREELTKAWLSILPGVDLRGGAALYTNSFFVNPNWLSAGAKISWNLMSVFKLPNRQATIASEEELIETRAKALGMAIITQVHVARAHYQHRVKAYRLAGEMVDVQSRILTQITASILANATGENELVRERLSSLVAEARKDVAYADLQNAYANVIATLGVDPLSSAELERLSVQEIARLLVEPAERYIPPPVIRAVPNGGVPVSEAPARTLMVAR